LSLLLELFRRGIRINYYRELLFLGSRKNRQIARAWSAHHLSRPTRDNVIRYVVQMETAAELPAWDPALAAAVVMLTGSD